MSLRISNALVPAPFALSEVEGQDRCFDFAQHERRRGGLLIVSALALGACSGEPANTQALAVAEANQASEAADDGLVNCAVDGAEAFARTCTLDRQQTAQGLVLTIRHPDGGFRRFKVTRDGRGVVAADGAEPADVAITGPEEIEVGVGDDHYRLPATIKAGASKSAG
jgi:hypothetical protein